MEEWSEYTEPRGVAGGLAGGGARAALHRCWVESRQSQAASTATTPPRLPVTVQNREEDTQSEQAGGLVGNQNNHLSKQN